MASKSLVAKAYGLLKSLRNVTVQMVQNVLSSAPFSPSAAGRAPCQMALAPRIGRGMASGSLQRLLCGLRIAMQRTRSWLLLKSWNDTSMGPPMSVCRYFFLEPEFTRSLSNPGS